ncbi:maltose ABC transporter substrate-binding protein [Cellulomonas endometrii]|uniref:sugar ABC transporter substrate-binding protein n=1 Tax=Cellulomonas endometrii TaxID=3036301 RepID=UPI0024ACC3CB|nr:maltose ABC transporter substrate-binding protein [Cellulomonas endometrii]
MKRTATGALACATLLLALTACSSGGGGEAAGGGDEPVTLVVWESLEGRQEFIEQAGEAYAEEHPNVTIEYKNVEIGDALGQIGLDGPAGVGPDVFAGPSNITGDLVTGGHILPVSDREALESELVDGAVRSVTYEDDMWGVPVTIDTYALFYNKDYVTEPPTTWEEVAEFAAGFNASNPGKYGFAFSPNIYYAAPFVFTDPDNMLFGPEGDDPATPNTDTPAAVEGLQEMLALRDVLDVAADDLDTASVDTLFESGQSAMTITGSWNIPVFEDAGLDFGVATLPARAGSDEPSGSFANSRTMFVSAYTEHPDEAQDFAAFLASPEMLQLAYDLTGSVPSADIEIDSEATLGLVEQGTHSMATPSIPQMTQFWTAMDSAVANIWNGADIQTELTAATDVITAQ